MIGGKRPNQTEHIKLQQRTTAEQQKVYSSSVTARKIVTISL